MTGLAQNNGATNESDSTGNVMQIRITYKYSEVYQEVEVIKR